MWYFKNIFDNDRCIKYQKNILSPSVVSQAWSSKVNMKFVLLLSILLSLILVVLGQQPTISCFYSTSADYGYSCSMEIYNPNGLNNFNEINGTHLVGKTNDDVRYVVIAGPLRSTTIFPSIICETFRNVTQINFASVGIQRIDNDSFSSCLSLEVLILYFNKINRIDVNAFINNKNLTTLELRNNELTEVHENTFVNQEQLTALTLSTNFISDFGDNTFKPLKNLEMLAFNTNFITILKHSWFESLENLQILFIYQNVISDLPKGIFAPLSKMYLLAAAQMNLTVIHSNSFGLLPNLNTIDFYNNKINAFDERLIDNTAIGTLDMISNWCANEWIQDHSESREVLRAAMSACFENYRNLTGGK